MKSAKPLSKLGEKSTKQERASTPKGKSKLQIKDKLNHKNDVLNKTAKHPDKKQSKIKKDDKEAKEKRRKKKKKEKKRLKKKKKKNIN